MATTGIGLKQKLTHSDKRRKHLIRSTTRRKLFHLHQTKTCGDIKKEINIYIYCFSHIPKKSFTCISYIPSYTTFKYLVLVQNKYLSGGPPASLPFPPGRKCVAKILRKSICEARRHVLLKSLKCLPNY